jgi:hypothetical protein
MPITKLEAIAACVALRDVVKNTAIDNAQYHDQSHWSETNARAALASKDVCGYYYKTNKYWYRDSTGQKWSTVEAISPKIKKTCRLVEERLPIAVNDSYVLIQAALRAGEEGKALYKQSAVAGRCLVLAPFPPDYGGVTLYRNNPAQDPCAYVALVISCGANQNASLVTHYPATQAYANGQADLA